MAPVATHTSTSSGSAGGKAKFSTQEIIEMEHEYSA
jgi:hypothetical protein